MVKNLDLMEKGIIAAPARVSGNGAQFRSEGRLTPEELRYFLMYWDKVVIPTTNLVHLAVPEEEELLTTLSPGISLAIHKSNSAEVFEDGLLYSANLYDERSMKTLLLRKKWSGA